MAHPALARVAHRPWPMPVAPWSWRQNWYDLLFAHWPVPVEQLRPVVPVGLEVQEFNGVSWVGVVPFRMTGVMRRPLPDLPWISAFAELNLRLYVQRDGKPGVWFLSLDAGNALAVWAARRFFHLPYHRARIAMHKSTTGEVTFRSTRLSSTPVNFSARYTPRSAPRLAERGSLEAFLVERYCLYTQSPDGRLLRGEVHHVPWPIQDADADVDAGELLGAYGLVVQGAPLLHFSRGVDVVVWPLQVV